LPENVSLARTCAAAVVAQMDCTLEELEEVKLVISEAVSNCIIHGYGNQPDGKIILEISLYDNGTVEMLVADYGRGIEDVARALQPAYSSEAGRMGMGFTFMKSFSDHMKVDSTPGQGTAVTLIKNLGCQGKQALA